MRSLSILVLGVGGLILGACAAPGSGVAPATGFGDAVASMEAQIVPGPVDLAPPEGDGAVAAAALNRYETDKVKKLENQSSSSVAIMAASPN